MEIDRKDKITKNHSTYKHQITITYPRQNVENMKKGWRTFIQEHEEWIKNQEEILEEQLQAGLQELNNRLEEVKNQTLVFAEKPKEEIKNILYQQYLDNIKEKLDFIEQKEIHEKELKQSIEEQFQKQVAQVKSQIKEKRDALKLWEREQ